MPARFLLPVFSAMLIILISATAHAYSTTVILGDFDHISSRCTDSAFGDLFMTHGYNAWAISAHLKSGVAEWGGDELSILDRRTGITFDSLKGYGRSELTLRYDQHWLEEIVLVFIDESDYSNPAFLGADITVVSGTVSPAASVSTTTLNTKLGGDPRAYGELAYQVFKPQQLVGVTHHTLRISVPDGGRFRLLAVVANSGRDITPEGRRTGLASVVQPLDSLAVIEDSARYYFDLCAIRERVYGY